MISDQYILDKIPCLGEARRLLGDCGLCLSGLCCCVCDTMKEILHFSGIENLGLQKRYANR